MFIIDVTHIYPRNKIINVIILRDSIKFLKNIMFFPPPKLSSVLLSTKWLPTSYEGMFLFFQVIFVLFGLLGVFPLLKYLRSIKKNSNKIRRFFLLSTSPPPPIPLPLDQFNMKKKKKRIRRRRRRRRRKRKAKKRFL